MFFLLLKLSLGTFLNIFILVLLTDLGDGGSNHATIVTFHKILEDIGCYWMLKVESDSVSQSVVELNI